MPSSLFFSLSQLRILSKYCDPYAFNNCKNNIALCKQIGCVSSVHLQELSKFFSSLRCNTSGKTSPFSSNFASTLSSLALMMLALLVLNKISAFSQTSGVASKRIVFRSICFILITVCFWSYRMVLSPIMLRSTKSCR